jgi:hypothetical protein
MIWHAAEVADLDYVLLFVFNIVERKRVRVVKSYGAFVAKIALVHCAQTRKTSPRASMDRSVESVKFYAVTNGCKTEKALLQKGTRIQGPPIQQGTRKIWVVRLTALVMRLVVDRIKGWDSRMVLPNLHRPVLDPRQDG